MLRFLEIANSLRPKIVLIENVPQMLRHGRNGVLGGLADSVKSMLEDMGYAGAVGVLNSADYGVPQLRERTVFLASRIGAMELPEPTHANPEDAGASEARVAAMDDREGRSGRFAGCGAGDGDARREARGAVSEETSVGLRSADAKRARVPVQPSHALVRRAHYRHRAADAAR